MTRYGTSDWRSGGFRMEFGSFTPQTVTQMPRIFVVPDGPAKVKIKGVDFNYWSRMGRPAYLFAHPPSENEPSSARASRRPFRSRPVIFVAAHLCGDQWQGPKLRRFLWRFLCY